VSWLYLTIASAFLLAFYDYFKKLALHNNAVLPVIFGSVAAGALVWLPFVAWSALAPASLPADFLYVTGISARSHGLLFGKAVIVGTSWLLGYYGIKALPLSIAAPIRATGPLWTITFAVLLMHEAPSPKQWVGVAFILAAFFAFSFVGCREGIHFHRNPAVFFMIGASLFGAASTLFDKYLLQVAHLTPCQVQAWFTIYTCLILIPPLALWRRRGRRHPFHWHWAIPLIGITLLGADFLYFSAIAQPGSLISLIAPLRHAAVIVAFLLGIFLLREKHRHAKAACVAAIITGLILLS